MTEWLRWVGGRCSRSASQPTSISFTASAALTPVQGEVAACAVLPKNSYSTDMTAYWRGP